MWKTMAIYSWKKTSVDGSSMDFDISLTKFNGAIKPPVRGTRDRESENNPLGFGGTLFSGKSDD